MGQSFEKQATVKASRPWPIVLHFHNLWTIHPSNPERKAVLLYGGHQHMQSWNFWCQQSSPCDIQLWSPDKAQRGHKLRVLTMVKGAAASFLMAVIFREGGIELGSQLRGYSSSRQGHMVARVAQLPERGAYRMGLEARQGYDHQTSTLGGLYRWGRPSCWNFHSFSKHHH